VAGEFRPPISNMSSRSATDGGYTPQIRLLGSLIEFQCMSTRNGGVVVGRRCALSSQWRLSQWSWACSTATCGAFTILVEPLWIYNKQSQLSEYVRCSVSPTHSLLYPEAKIEYFFVDDHASEHWPLDILQMTFEQGSSSVTGIEFAVVSIESITRNVSCHRNALGLSWWESRASHRLLQMLQSCEGPGACQYFLLSPPSSLVDQFCSL
jgi:hypothetical protein